MCAGTRRYLRKYAHNRADLLAPYEKNVFPYLGEQKDRHFRLSSKMPKCEAIEHATNQWKLAIASLGLLPPDQ